MRRPWISIVCVIALLLYVGWVLDHHQRQASTPPAATISALDRVMAKAGASLESATFSLMAPIADPALPEQARARLGWTGAPLKGEQRVARLHTDQGGYYLALQWQMTGDRAGHWVANHTSLTQTLDELGIRAPVHIQLEGKTAQAVHDLMALAHGALDSVAAVQRQPWTGEKSASVAGRSPRLPAGPHPVNVQVAARQSGQAVKLWVAWPALTGDY